MDSVIPQDSNTVQTSTNISSSPTPSVPPVTPAMPTVETPNMFSNTIVVPIAEVPNKNGKSKIILFLVSIFIIMTVIIFGLLYAVTYGNLKFNQPDLENKIAFFVQSLPLTPKTPKYLIQAVINAQKKVTRHSLDFSISYKTEELTSILGTDQLDISIKGAVDYTDTKNLLGNLTIGVTKDFNLEVLKPNKIVYGKIDKLPPLLMNYLGFTQNAQLTDVLNHWFSYDTTPILAEMEKNNELTKENADKVNKKLQDVINGLSSERLSSFFKVSDDKIDGFPCYKVELISPTGFLDYIDEEIKKTNSSSTNTSFKISDMISDFKFNAWIDKKDYYFRKYSGSYSMKNPYSYSVLDSSSNQTTSPTISISMNLKLADFNKPLAIEAPQNSIPVEEYFKQLMEQSPVYMQQQKQSTDAIRRSDVQQIVSAIDRYEAINGKYPNNLDEVMTAGELKSIPTDPETKLPYECVLTTNGYTVKARLSDGTDYVVSYP